MFYSGAALLKRSSLFINLHWKILLYAILRHRMSEIIISRIQFEITVKKDPSKVSPTGSAAIAARIDSAAEFRLRSVRLRLILNEPLSLPRFPKLRLRNRERKFCAVMRFPSFLCRCSLLPRCSWWQSIRANRDYLIRKIWFTMR